MEAPNCLLIVEHVDDVTPALKICRSMGWPTTVFVNDRLERDLLMTRDRRLEVVTTFKLHYDDIRAYAEGLFTTNRWTMIMSTNVTSFAATPDQLNSALMEADQYGIPFVGFSRGLETFPYKESDPKSVYIDQDLYAVKGLVKPIEFPNSFFGLSRSLYYADHYGLYRSDLRFTKRHEFDFSGGPAQKELSVLKGLYPEYFNA